MSFDDPKNQIGGIIPNYRHHPVLINRSERGHIVCVVRGNNEAHTAGIIPTFLLCFPGLTLCVVIVVSQPIPFPKV